ncbi:hypothetical protein V5799_012964 [Amblyomma americanum]|uniref:Peptidase M13 N-terminal domain-containing protein n=1 Tax=Amblyomma americanum TaxID=6943 RepID=A0AAQ4E7C1_AMBAM
MPSAEPKHDGHRARPSFAGRSTSLGKSQAPSPKRRANRSLPLAVDAASSRRSASTGQPRCRRECCAPRDAPRQRPGRGASLHSDSSLVRGAGPRLAATSRRRPSESDAAPQQTPRHAAQPPPPQEILPQATSQGRSGTLFAFAVAAFVLLCSGAISAYYVWYSHEEFARQHTARSSLVAQLPQTTTTELQAPLLVAPQAPPVAELTTEATTSRREMYFGTPLGRRRALKLRPEEEATPELASRRRRCLTRFCQERSDAVLSALNWTVDPCADFEAFTCSRRQQAPPADALLAEQLERELYLSLSSKLKPEVWRVEGLLEECLRSPLPQASRLQLRALLRDLGLYGWPFRADTQSRGDVWKAAALLFRHLALAPLMGVAVAPHPRNASQPLVALDEPQLLAQESHALDAAFKQYTPGRYVELAERVGDFSSRLSQIVTGRRAARLSTLRSHASFAPFLALAVGDLVRLQERTPLLVRCERFARALKALLHATRNRDLLNYLGYRALVHVSPLLTEEARPLSAVRMLQITGRRRYGWPRWRRCVRLAERAAPELMAYALARAAQLDRLAGLRLARDLAAAVNESLGAFGWLADADRRNARTLLAALDVQVCLKAAPL